MTEIPKSHWSLPPDNPAQARYLETFIPCWEKQLRRRIAEEPDPEKRFSNWLLAVSKGESSCGCALVFIEEPYFAWAKLIKAALEKTKEETRQEIAAEIANPREY